MIAIQWRQSGAEATQSGTYADSVDRWLRTLAVAAGICWSVLFVLLGLRYQLQMYGDGSMFSYAVAVEDAWTFHWHNIIGRLFVFLFASAPAEFYLEITRNPREAVDIYGLLFFAAPLLGLLATFAADRSKGRIIFMYACLSIACLCPLVFGFPTELWVAHSLFWPALAVCHYARPGLGGTVLVFAVLLALVFTHEGALIFAVAILATLLLRGGRDTAFVRAASVFVVVTAVWMIARVAFPPDDYIGDALRRAAWHVFDPSIFTGYLILILLGALAGYGVALLLVWRLAPTKAHIYAVATVTMMLVVYWIWFDHALHAENRYYLRTVMLIATPVLGILAAVHALDAEGRRLRVPLPTRVTKLVASDAVARAVAGALLLVLLVHAVETAKFIRAWTAYTAAVRNLAVGADSDPALGDPRFVSSQRIDPALNRVAWSSTTHFLSVLVAPSLAPRRLVIDPSAGYFWLSCETATRSREANRAVPVDTRELIRVHACLHR
jgi:hypothetical protein